MTSPTPVEIETIATEAARAAVREFMVAMGVDTSDPKALLAMQADFAHMRKWRESIDTVRTQGLKVAIGIIVTFMAGAILLSIRGR